jgi:hypothetical protein
MMLAVLALEDDIRYRELSHFALATGLVIKRLREAEALHLRLVHVHLLHVLGLLLILRSQRHHEKEYATLSHASFAARAMPRQLGLSRPVLPAKSRVKRL